MAKKGINRLNFWREVALCHTVAASDVKEPSASEQPPPLDLGGDTQLKVTQGSVMLIESNSHLSTLRHFARSPDLV